MFSQQSCEIRARKLAPCAWTPYPRGYSSFYSSWRVFLMRADVFCLSPGYPQGILVVLVRFFTFSDIVMAPLQNARQHKIKLNNMHATLLRPPTCFVSFLKSRSAFYVRSTATPDRTLALVAVTIFCHSTCSLYCDSTKLHHYNRAFIFQFRLWPVILIFK